MTIAVAIVAVAIPIHLFHVRAVGRVRRKTEADGMPMLAERMARGLQNANHLKSRRTTCNRGCFSTNAVQEVLALQF